MRLEPAFGYLSLREKPQCVCYSLVFLFHINQTRYQCVLISQLALEVLVGRFCQLFSPVSSFCAYLNKVNLLLAVASYFTDRYKSGINISILTLSKKVNKAFFKMPIC